MGYLGCCFSACSPAQTLQRFNLIVLIDCGGESAPDKLLQEELAEPESSRPIDFDIR